MQQPDRSSAGSSAFYAHYQSSPSRSNASSLYEPLEDASQSPLGITLPPSFSFQRPAPLSREPTPKPLRVYSVDILSSTSPHPSSLSSPNTPRAVDGTPRPASIDSPRSARLAAEPFGTKEKPQWSPAFEPRDLDQYPHGHTPTVGHTPTIIQQDTTAQHEQPSTTPTLHTYPPRGRLSDANPSALIPRPRYERSTTSYHTAQDSVSDYNGEQSGVNIGSRSLSSSSTMSSRGKSPNAPPGLKLQVDGNNTTALEGNSGNQESGKVQKSPPGSSFFGWRRTSNQNESPTTISESRTLSPAPSGLSNMQQNKTRDVNPSSPAPEEEEDYFATSSYYDSNSPLPGGGDANLTHIDQLLRELREVSSELAIAIRREMELEDELDRCKTDMPSGPMEHSRRTSDYYSDSGASSLRLVAADSDTKIEGLEKMRRKAEQEKAQLRLEMSQRSQEDLNQRRALEMHVQSLEEQLQMRGASNGDRSIEHQRELVDTKRRLNEEREFKENFEDLLRGMREEIESHRNERDNLRDEVVPQLRSRLEGLETQANDMQTLAYENTRLQQENQGLKNENQTLVNARRLQLDMQNQSPRFKSIAEGEEEAGAPGSPGLGRSNSLVRSRSMRNRSNSLTEPHADGIKAIEDQRDALQRTLKSLIIRQDHMTQNHAKHIRSLEIAKNKALDATPRRAAFKFEVQHLRSEINRARQRADDAMEQKWQCDKGLSGLKMDLDRAQQETSSLRELLLDNDSLALSDSDEEDSESLNTAYADLQSIHAATMAKLQSNPHVVNQEEILSSDRRMRDLSKEIEARLKFNSALRRRLSDAIERGVKEQQLSAHQIANLESALSTAEERLVTATSVSEEAIAKQEEYVKNMRNAADEQSRRGISRFPASNRFSNVSMGAPSPRVNLTPKNAFVTGTIPRLEKTSSGNGIGVGEACQTEILEKRVRELEETASSADKQMQQVIEMMNRAQIEVAELQTERDDAMRRTRRLKTMVLAESEWAKALAT